MSTPNSVRFLLFFTILVFFSSCDYFSFKRKNDFEEINSNIDMTSVDVPPSFGRCNAIIDKKEKTDCFYQEIHKEISKSLRSQNIQVKKDLDETVEVVIRIHANSEVKLTSIKASDALYAEIPDFKKMLEKAIADLPKIYPAIKRESKVTTEYMLPIRISLHN